MIILLLIIFVMVIALMLTMIFSGSETAITSLEYRHSLKEIKNVSLKINYLLDMWEKFPWKLLNTILIANNASVVLITVLSTSLAVSISQQTNTKAGNITFLSSLIISVIIFIFGEMLPKIIARITPKTYFIKVAPVLYIAEKIIMPINKIFNKLLFLMLKVLGMEIQESSNILSNSDIEALLDLGEAKGIIKESEKDVIEALINFADITVNEIMVPRAKMDCLNVVEGLDAMVKKADELKHSRIPIYENNFDNIIGILNVKDLLVAWENRALIFVQDILRPAYFIPPTKKINELLREFKQGHYHLAIIVDEYGTVLGMVTIEDILEEIVGEILDEYDVDESIIIPISDGVYSVNPDIELDILDKKLKLNLEDKAPEEVRTLSGYIMSKIGRLPQKNEFIQDDNITFCVSEISKRAIKKVFIYKKKTK